MHKTALATILVALSMIWTPSPAWAGKGHGEHMFKSLNLTAEQKTKLAEIRKSKMEKTKPLREQFKKEREALQQKMQSEATDDELRKSHAAVQNLKAQMGTAHFENVLAIRSLLTPEQRKKFAELHKQNKGKRGGMWRGHGDDEDDEE